MKYYEEPKETPCIHMLLGHNALKSPPRVIIDFYAFQKIKMYIDLCPDEINGLAMVDEMGGDLLITAPFILKQFSAREGLHVEHNHLEFNRCVTEMVKRNEDPARIKCQWHSHAWIGAFFSGEDIDTLRGYSCDYMISLVMNKRGEHKCRLDIFRPLCFGFDVKLFVRIPKAHEGLLKACQEDIDAKVSYSFLSKAAEKLWPAKGEPSKYFYAPSEIMVGVQNLLEPKKEGSDEPPKTA